jgi:hypothetical protein
LFVVGVTVLKGWVPDTWILPVGIGLGINWLKMYRINSYRLAPWARGNLQRVIFVLRRHHRLTRQRTEYESLAEALKRPDPVSIGGSDWAIPLPAEARTTLAAFVSERHSQDEQWWPVGVARNAPGRDPRLWASFRRVAPAIWVFAIAALLAFAASSLNNRWAIGLFVAVLSLDPLWRFVRLRGERWRERTTAVGVIDSVDGMEPGKPAAES